jgi:hypothetical protein
MSLTKVTYSMIEGNTVTPEDFGAVGDGVADDTEAIQAAIDYFSLPNQINGGIIKAENNYAISDTLLFKNASIDFCGSGFGAVRESAKTYLIWIGPAGIPMIRLQSCRATKIRNLRLIGNVTNKPSAAINFYVNNVITPPADISQNSFNQVENIWISTYDGLDTSALQPGAPGSFQFTHGILFDGSNTGNNYDTFRNIRIGQCNNGVSIATNQFGQNLFDGLWCTFCQYGFSANAPAIGINWFFDNNQVADIILASDARLQVYEFASEVSYQMAQLDTGGRLTIYGGSFSTNGSTFSGTVIDGAGGNSVAVDLNDFTLFNNPGDPYVGTPLFKFTSANDDSNKYFSGRGIRGITAAMIDGNLGAGNTNQRFWVDLEVVPVSGQTPLRIQNYLGPNAYTAESINTNRYDIPVNAYFKSGSYKKVQTFSASATPSVANGDVWYTSGTTAITNFADGTTGQTITILATGNITITNGASIQLAGATNFAMTDLDTLTLIQVSSNLWRELSRSVN